MNGTDEPAQESGAPRGQDPRTGAPGVRIGESPDLDTVLTEALAEACALTGARYGAVAALERGGQAHRFVTSGLAEEERARLTAWSGGPRLFEHLREVDGPLRLADMAAYADSLGLASEERLLPKTFLGMPMRHGGADAGYLFLADKEGAFTEDDEALLLQVASRAAAAVVVDAPGEDAANRLRADFDALVHTAPVGVVIFDAATGDVLSINQECKRIVEGLRTPGHTSEQMLEVIVIRRADGREVDLARTALASALQGAETVRGEEVRLSTPDGRNATILINATPVRSAHGTVASVIVTMQDLAPIQELERLRSQFLGMVSHELRAPLTSIKGSAATLLEAASDLDPAVMREFHRIIAAQADHMNGLINDLLDAGRIDAGTLSVSPEPSELAALVDRARNTFLSGGGLHTVLIDLPPDLPPVMADRRRIVQVVNNLFSNAARHAPESSPIRVAALRDGVHVAVSVSDEGKGIAPERLPKLFQKYTGAGDGGRELAGTGLGLAICKGLVEAHGGRIWAESGGPGQGARLTFTLPVAEEAHAGSAAATSQPVQSGRVLEETRILVVDDDPHMLRYVRDALSDAGYAPLVTGDHRELAHILRTERPQLVVLDLVLPETDGIELMETVPGLTDLPVIFISAYGRDETDRAGVRGRRGGLHRQAVLDDRAHGADPGRAAPPRRARAVRARRACHRLRRAPGERGRPPGRADRQRVRVPARALAQRRARVGLRVRAAPGLGQAGGPRRQERAAHPRQGPSPEARRYGDRFEVHPHRARRRLPHAPARWYVNPVSPGPGARPRWRTLRCRSRQQGGRPARASPAG